MPLDEFRNAKTAQRIDAFAAIRAVLGDEQYFRILGVMGVERADQFANLGAAVKAYTEMLESYNFATAARTVA